MIDQNKFINKYLELSTKSLHDNINSLLQVKTSEALLRELLDEKNAEIQQLNDRLIECEDKIKELSELRALKVENEVLTTKTNHFATAIQQIADMKQTIKQQHDIMERQSNEIKALKKQRKNTTKASAATVTVTAAAVETPIEQSDF